MQVQIKNRWSGRVLFEGEFETFASALIEAARKGAYLSGACLYGANLSGACLYGADLSGANLYGADLYGASGIDRNRSIPLLILFDQPGKIRAYKLVTKDGFGYQQRSIKYESGVSYSVDDASTDDEESCDAGLHVATLDWCMREWREDFRILVVEFEAKDIACIPTCTDGKFRLHRLTVVGEKDLAVLGLVAKTEAAAPAVEEKPTKVLHKKRSKKGAK